MWCACVSMHICIYLLLFSVFCAYLSGLCLSQSLMCSHYMCKGYSKSLHVYLCYPFLAKL